MRKSQVLAGLGAVLVTISASVANASPARRSATETTPNASAAATDKAQAGAKTASDQQQSSTRSFSHEATPSYDSFPRYRSSYSSSRFLHADRKLRGEY